MKRLGWAEAFSRGGIDLDLVKFFSEVVKWLILIIFLMVASEAWGLSQFSQFLGKVVDYFPNILVSSLIFIATLFLIDFTYRIFFATVKETGEKTEVSYSKLLGVVVRRAIWVLATLAILYQLQIVPNLILSIFIAILVLIVLAVGISFGLGGKEIAKKILDEWKEKL
jgi:small-conductance mechanosensitive channel